ncbi:MAG: ATPase [Bacteroidota bacterium]
MVRLSVMILLDRLEELFDARVRVAGRVWVDADTALECLQKIREALPDEIRQAEWMLSEKDRLLHEAHEEAKRILRDAENYAAKLVQDSQIIRQAEHEGEKIVAEARREAATVVEEAREYAGRILAQLEESLQKALRFLQKSRSDLTVRE